MVSHLNSKNAYRYLNWMPHRCAHTMTYHSRNGRRVLFVLTLTSFFHPSASIGPKSWRNGFGFPSFFSQLEQVTPVHKVPVSVPKVEKMFPANTTSVKPTSNRTTTRKASAKARARQHMTVLADGPVGIPNNEVKDNSKNGQNNNNDVTLNGNASSTSISMLELGSKVQSPEGYIFRHMMISMYYQISTSFTEGE